MLAAAIAASNEVVLPVWGLALFVSLWRRKASLKYTRVASKGCLLVLSDGNSGSIGGVHSLNLGGGMQLFGWNSQNIIQQRALILSVFNLTAGAVSIVLYGGI